MKFLPFLGIVALTLLMYFIWYRKPPGRSTSDPGESDIRGVKDFDEANPNAPAHVRAAFYNAVQAHLSDNFVEAREGYRAVIDEIPEEPTARHNLSQVNT